MDAIRERIAYKDVAIHICFQGLGRKEQYECVRMVLAHREKGVTLCTHGCANAYIQTLIEGLRCVGFQCIDSCSDSASHQTS